MCTAHDVVLPSLGASIRLSTNRRFWPCSGDSCVHACSNTCACARFTARGSRLSQYSWDLGPLLNSLGWPTCGQNVVNCATYTCEREMVKCSDMLTTPTSNSSQDARVPPPPLLLLVIIKQGRAPVARHRVHAVSNNDSPRRHKRRAWCERRLGLRGDHCNLSTSTRWSTLWQTHSLKTSRPLSSEYKQRHVPSRKLGDVHAVVVSELRNPHGDGAAAFLSSPLTTRAGRSLEYFSTRTTRPQTLQG
jgi:hypothetical protein